MSIDIITKVFVSSIFVAMFFSICGSKFLSSKLKINLKNICLILFLSMFVTINYLFLDNVAKLVTLYIVVLFTYKCLYGKNVIQCAVSAFISYLLLVLGEILFVVGISIVHMEDVLSDTTIFQANIVANFIICALGICIMLLIYKPVYKLLKKIREDNKFSLFFVFTVVLIAIGALLYKMYYDNWKLNTALNLNLLLIVCMMCIGFVIIKQNLDKDKISEDYEKYVEYSKQSERLVEQYSISQHENQNELIIIKSMVNKNNRKLLEYLDEIIKSKDNIENSWIKYLKYIPFGGLKGIIHNKVSVMKELGLNVVLDISKSIEKSKLKKLSIKENNQLSKIIGVFLDNAIEASIKSDIKEITICIYCENKNVIFEIANSYSGVVDLNKIYESGHTSKGRKRGYGLSLVRNIVEDNKMFENEVKIENDYFIQKLKVNL